MRLSLAAGAAVMCCLWAVRAQSDLPRDVVQLSRIKAHMKERLLQVPNYTCLETIERMQKLPKAGKFKLLDTVRLEVAEVSGKELLAQPGGRFEEGNPATFVHSGVMANGLFSTHTRALFIHDAATFTYAGKDEFDGRNLVRYDFQVSLLRSGYTIVRPHARAVVAYHGSFWCDPLDYDMYHLRVIADNIPRNIGLLDAGLEIEYQKVRIGPSDALLPRKADLNLIEFGGRENRNIITFSECRQYGSDSVVSFEAEPAAPPPAPEKAK
jgi:hypothetical protein